MFDGLQSSSWDLQGRFVATQSLTFQVEDSLDWVIAYLDVWANARVIKCVFRTSQSTLRSPKLEMNNLQVSSHVATPVCSDVPSFDEALISFDEALIQRLRWKTERVCAFVLSISVSTFRESDLILESHLLRSRS